MPDQLLEFGIGDNTFMADIPVKKLIINERQLMKALGYPEDHQPEEMNGLIESLKTEILSLCEISAGYTIKSAGNTGASAENIVIAGIPFKVGKIIARQLRGIQEAALLVCTIGSGPERRVKELLDAGDAASGYIADAVASVAVEQVVEIMHTHIESKYARSGNGITNRFSPGYCGWNVEEQGYLFGLLPAGFCNVSLGKSAFMHPRKSVSSIIGIGSGLKRKEYPCNFCPNDQCLYGKTKQDTQSFEKGGGSI